jgi:hypothetical protein
MEIEVPLGNRKLLKVLLKDVLYAQDIGVTLVSISRITTTGHKAIFDGPSLKIYNSSKKLLGEVPVNRGLYCVEHSEFAHSAVETADNIEKTMVQPPSTKPPIIESLLTLKGTVGSCGCVLM